MIVKCSFCNKDFYIKPNKVKKQKTHCCSIKCSKELRKITSLGENNPNYGNTGHKSKLFKSDTKITNYGYIKKYCPEHPLCDHMGWVMEHRLVIEKSGLFDKFLENKDGYKFLPKKYEVHHVDENKLNNDINNLIVLTKSEHTKLHNSKKEIIRDKKSGRILKIINKENK